MKPTAMQLRKALEERLVSVLRPGDLVEYLDLSGGWRGGRVVRVQPRAGRVIVGAYARADLPRGHKDLARYVSKTHRLVLAAQIVGVLVKEDGRHVSVRPGTDAWVTFTEARAAGRESGSITAVGTEHQSRMSEAQSALYPRLKVPPDAAAAKSPEAIPPAKPAARRHPETEDGCGT